MPRLTLREVHLPEVHLPELRRLPDMRREDIARALGDARPEVELDLPKFEMPKFDLAKLEIPRIEAPDSDVIDKARAELAKIDLPNVDLSKIDLPKAVATAAQAAGIVKASRRPSRGRMVLGALVVLGIVGFALATSPVFRPRIEALARRARQRLDERRGKTAGPVAFDAAETAPVQDSPYSASAPYGSPFDGPSELPEGLGSERPISEPTTV
jgi:hypothetical protein